MSNKCQVCHHKSALNTTSSLRCWAADIYDKNKSSCHHIPLNILVNAFSAVANVKIAINRAILGKPYPVFLPGVCILGGGGHQHKLLKHCVIATRFVLQQMKCGLLDSDNPANGPWRKVVQAPLWACHSLICSLPHSLAHCLTRSFLMHCSRLACKTATLPPFGEWSAHLNSHFPLETQTSRLSDAPLVPFLYESPQGGLFPSGPYGEMVAAPAGPPSILSPTERLPVRAG